MKFHLKLKILAMGLKMFSLIYRLLWLGIGGLNSTAPSYLDPLAFQRFTMATVPHSVRFGLRSPVMRTLGK